jgi:plasmid stabilization system protein ParE
MAREVIWTDPGWDDLEAAADYIARDSEFYAASLVQEAREAASTLSDFAERGQVVPEFDDESICSYLAATRRGRGCNEREVEWCSANSSGPCPVLFVLPGEGRARGDSCGIQAEEEALF